MAPLLDAPAAEQQEAEAQAAAAAAAQGAQAVPALPAPPLPRQPKLLATLADHFNAVNVARFSPDGRLLASGSDSNLVGGRACGCVGGRGWV